MTAATLAASTAAIQVTSRAGQQPQPETLCPSPPPTDLPATTGKSQIDDPSAPLVHPWHWHGTQDYGQAYRCLVCDDGPPARLLHLRCGHYHCTPCLERQLAVRVSDPIFRPVRCCSAVDIDTLRRVVLVWSSSSSPASTSPCYYGDDSELSNPAGPAPAPGAQGHTTTTTTTTEAGSLLEAYAERYEEWAADLKLYCHDARCGAFIPVAARSWRRGTCPRCRGQTCVRCGGAAHPWLLSCVTGGGIRRMRLRSGGKVGGGRRAAATEADVKLLELAGQKGW
ncbi:uncharacterized protein E0L32_009710 [Thyridium curvatum]|uniref:IBR domain-containing protein n=1 Tax=Thyridium curvatum TaxID=1093900 RepID=A0A507AWX0_9PEZI|nr:uncharacterized protein E0L32_009710 [Thyridium curvatum]TPX08770.1 hypothetical protein E0L32_009710 [Thyridium curvatum]